MIQVGQQLIEAFNPFDLDPARLTFCMAFKRLSKFHFVLKHS
jgi:hypothetical protein